MIRVCILLFVLVNTVYSQSEKLIFKHLTSTDGLSNNWVRCIYKDDIGFMWFGTADGLCRYDGHMFEIYRPKTYNGNSIGNINISEILRKNSNEIWVCTDLGVYIYNYLKDELTPFSTLKYTPVLCAEYDNRDYLWFGTTNGLFRYDSSNHKLDSFYFDVKNSASISDNYINTVYEDSKNNLWIGTKNGLNKYNSVNQTFQKFKPSDIYKNVSTNDVLSICEDRNGYLWVGYAQDGLYLLKQQINGDTKFKRITGGKIIDLLIDNQNILWIGKGSNEGLERIDLNSYDYFSRPVTEHYQHNIFDKLSLSDNSIFSIYEDDFKDIWIGTFGNGVNYYSLRTKKFYTVGVKNSFTHEIYNNLVNSFLEDNNYIYIGTEGGLNVINKLNGITTQYQNEKNNPYSLSGNPVYAIHKDSYGKIWIGTWSGGLSIFNPETGKFSRKVPGINPGSVSSANIFSIVEDKQKNIWIATLGGGLNRYDYKTGKLYQYRHDKNNPKSIYSDMLNCLYLTKAGKLYVSTHNSLDLFDFETESFKHYVHDYNDSSQNFGNIQSIFEDSRNNIWLATNSGLEYFNKKTGNFKAYTMQDGLPDNTIQAILEDDHGNLWISTMMGLSKFVNAINLPDKPEFINYTVADGLSSNEFKIRSAYKNNDGVMYFGSSQGFTFFHPDSIFINDIPPRVLITGFTLLNSSGNAHYNHELMRINSLHTVDLNYRNSDFKISFAALNYLNPQNNKFKYILQGYDDDWRDADLNQSATYTNLNPGEYVFMVKASNNDNIWCKTTETLTILIHPPWWETTLFKILMVVLVSTLLFVGYYLRVQILKNHKKRLEETVRLRTNELIQLNSELNEKQEEIIAQNDELSKHKYNLELLINERTSELKLAKEKAEESDRLKTAFLQNMSHEIRTPLNAILGFSGLLVSHFNNLNKLKRFTKIIISRGQDLMSIIDDILDIAKIESGQLQACKEYFKLNSLCDELELYYTNYQKQINKQDIKFIINKNYLKPETKIYSDKGKLKQVLTNLIGNAFKFTKAGEIEISCKKYNSNYLLFQVKDTGIGIPKEKHDVIFKRFRQIAEFKFREGTGLGLSICKGLIELLGGKIWLESTLNKGTTFYFIIPHNSSTN